MSLGSKCVKTGMASVLTISLTCMGAVSAQAATPHHAVSIATEASPDVAPPVEINAETRAVPILAIIGAVIAVGGTYYGMGQAAGERSYWAGLRNAEYQRVKWQVRLAAMAPLGTVGGQIFMTGFENKFYSMV